jgi:hypothetical protein
MGYMANDRTAVFLGNQSGQIPPPIETSNTYGIGINWSKGCSVQRNAMVC